MNKRYPWLLIGFTASLSLLIVVGTFLTQGINEDALRLTLRETARISFVLFLIVFLTSPFYVLRKNSATLWLMQHRRYLGISFGVSHLIHLVLIVYLVVGYSQGNPNNIATIDTYLIGGLGYLFIIAMLITSNNQSVKYLGFKRWKLLHRSGMYFLFISFLMSFIGLLEKDLPFYLPFVMAMLLALSIRVTAFYKTKSTQQGSTVRKQRSLV